MNQCIDIWRKQTKNCISCIRVRDARNQKKESVCTGLKIIHQFMCSVVIRFSQMHHHML